MKINSQCKVATESGTTLEPTFKPAGCLFHVLEVPKSIDQKSIKFNISCPFSGYCIAICNQFQTAVKFANLLHDLLLQNNLIEDYAKADTNEQRQQIWSEQTPLRKFYHLRLCKPGQFDKALAEQIAITTIKQ